MLRLVLLVAILTLARPADAQLARGHAKFLGNVYSTSQLPSFQTYWNQVTPENAGKWGSVEAQRDVMNWTTLDAAVQFAQQNGYPVRFHVLVWGNQQPGWIESLAPAEQLAEIEEWFAAVAARYPNLDFVEVVNEPLHDPPDGPGDGNYLAALGGTGTTGWDWVLSAFRLARTHFPNAKLMINEYGILSNPTKASQYLALVNLLRTENLIDGIGVQGHAFTTFGTSTSTMTTVLNLLATSGLPIQVTELEVDGANGPTAQKNEYERFFPTLWEHPAVQGITLWGWRDGMWRSTQQAMLVTTSGTEKIALIWLRSYLNGVLADAEDPGELPSALRIEPGYPNPFNPSITLPFELPAAARAVVRVFDGLGRGVDTIDHGMLPAGRHEFRWDAGDLPTGSYLVVLEAGGARATRTVALVR